MTANGPRHPGAAGASVTALLKGYISMWNERDPHARQSIGREVFIPDAHYVDPNVSARGRAAIDTYVAGWQDQFPGFVFVLGQVRSHHDVAHFGWHFGPPGEAPAAAGVDVVTMEQGRISAIYGFFDS